MNLYHIALIVAVTLVWAVFVIELAARYVRVIERTKMIGDRTIVLVMLISCMIIGAAPIALARLVA